MEITGSGVHLSYVICYHSAKIALWCDVITGSVVIVIWCNVSNHWLNRITVLYIFCKLLARCYYNMLYVINVMTC